MTHRAFGPGATTRARALSKYPSSPLDFSSTVPTHIHARSGWPISKQLEQCDLGCLPNRGRFIQ
jgi:hypothetical protein